MVSTSSTLSICMSSTMMILSSWSCESFLMILSKPTSSNTLFAVREITACWSGGSSVVVYFFFKASMNDSEASGFLVGRIKEPAPGILPGRHQPTSKMHDSAAHAGDGRNRAPLELRQAARTVKIPRLLVLSRVLSPLHLVPLNTEPHALRGPDLANIAHSAEVAIIRKPML